MMLFCEKICKDNIKIRFFEEKNGITVWEDFAEITEVHKQVISIVQFVYFQQYFHRILLNKNTYYLI